MFTRLSTIDAPSAARWRLDHVVDVATDHAHPPRTFDE
jgi:hypothetical protein